LINQNLLESKEKSDEELGAFLREKGIHSEHLHYGRKKFKKFFHQIPIISKKFQIKRD